MLGLRTANRLVAYNSITLNVISHRYKQIAHISSTNLQIREISGNMIAEYNQLYCLRIPFAQTLQEKYEYCVLKADNKTVKENRILYKPFAVCTELFKNYLSAASANANTVSNSQIKNKKVLTNVSEETFAQCEAETVSCSADQVKHSVVYTKGGDKGTSALFTGERRRKNDLVFEALGALDELTSHVGLARAMLRDMIKSSEVKDNVSLHVNMLMTSLEDIQQQLMNVSTVVATPAADETKVEGSLLKLLQSYTLSEKTQAMEKEIDVIDARLTPLRVFILPGGGNVTSAQLHVCRTVCRRAERRMVDVRDKYGEQYTDHLRQATVYVNRLSDYFFVAARSVAEEDIVRKSE